MICFLKVPREKTRKLAGEDLRVWVRVEVMKFTGHCGFTAFSSKLSKQSLGKGSDRLGESLTLCGGASLPQAD